MRPSLLATAALVALFPLSAPTPAQSTGFGDPAAALPGPLHPDGTLVAGDFDGDGDADLVEARSAQRSPIPLRRAPGLWLRHNEGHGTFGPRVQIATRSFVAVQSADLDGDKDLDLFAVVDNEAQGYLLHGFAYYLNDGKGGFREFTAITPLWGAEDFRLLDFDGDGDLDVLGIGAREAAQLLFVNDGKAQFGAVPASRFPQQSERVLGCTVGDFDGDRDPDLLFLLYGNPVRWSYWQNDGSGGYRDVTTTHVTASPIPNGTQRLTPAASDFDGDGDLDVLSYASDFGLVVLRNDGTGRFPSSITVRHSFPGGATSLLVFDGDGDGRDDYVATLASNTANVPLVIPAQVLQGRRGAVPADVTQQWLPRDTYGFEKAIAVDLDGDGDQDVVGGSQRGRLVRLNDGRGRLTAMPGEFLPLGPTSCGNADQAYRADLDRDGIEDLVLRRNSIPADDPSAIRLLLGRGGGRFHDVTSTHLPKEPTPSPSSGAQGVTIVDVDADGDLDLVTGSLRGNHSVLLNDGRARFTSRAQSSPYTLRAPAFAEDLDQDNDLDLISSYGHVWLNDGTGAFARNNALGLFRNQPKTYYIVQMPDWDRDGDFDLLAVDSGPYDALLFERTGPTSIRLRLRVPIRNQVNGGDWHAVDLDRDGRLDLLEVKSGEAHLATSAFTYVPSPEYSLPGYSDWRIIGDVDGDSWIDAIERAATAQGEIYQRVWLRDWRKGSYTDASATWSSRSDPYELGYLIYQLLDIDEDGDLDLLQTRNGRHVQRNLQGQLTVRGSAGVGKSAQILVHGTPGEVAIPFFGTATTRQSLPGIGLWRLAGAVTMLAPVQLAQQGAVGRAASSFAIPRQPSWIGMQVYFQALRVDLKTLQLQLTGFDVLRVTGL